MKPSESELPGFDKTCDQFRSWNWIYGKTPRFFLNTSYKYNGRNYAITANVYHGVFESCTVEHPPVDNGQSVVHPLDMSGVKYDLYAVSGHLKRWTQLHNHAEWAVLSSVALINAVELTL